MHTVGVDLAAEPKRTAVAWLDWSAGAATISDVTTGVDDKSIVEAIMNADKAGIDCPLGWPDAFVDFVTAHRAGTVEVPIGLEGWRRDLALRMTDKVVHERTGLTPLSVSTDRIGHPAMRCAALLAELARRGKPVDRGGAGVVVEVYPAASLNRWQLTHRGYKRAENRTELGLLVDELRAAAPWLDFGEHEETCRDSDDALDAVIAALAARAAAQGAATVPSSDQAGAARSEGWIALPTGSLQELPLDG